jgi:two-component system sensor histidine kinase DesK
LVRNQVLPGGVSLRIWKIYVHVWLICLIFPVATLVQVRPDVPGLAIVGAGLAVYVAFYIWFMRQHPLASLTDPGRREPVTQLAIALVTLLALMLSFLFGPTFLWLLVGVSMVAGRTLEPFSAHLIATVLPLLTIGIGLLLSGSPDTTDWLHILPLALLIRALGLNMLGLSLQFRVIRELKAAQEDLARRAAVEERLRLARDLHDLLGHTLSLIVLKSELAGRLVNKEPGHAAQEIRELETVARQALREVRQAVAEYRQLTLYGELDGARQMLEAAGITFALQNTIDAMPPSIEAVLAWVVREGVTNVIRHSRAHQCTMRLTRDERFIWAEITNDGCFEQTDEDQRAGSGLSGLTERVTAQGGTLQVMPATTNGTRTFALRVALPISGNANEKRRR